MTERGLRVKVATLLGCMAFVFRGMRGLWAEASACEQKFNLDDKSAVCARKPRKLHKGPKQD